MKKTGKKDVEPAGEGMVRNDGELSTEDLEGVAGGVLSLTAMEVEPVDFKPKGSLLGLQVEPVDFKPKPGM